jgi:hypothetical protein
VARGLVSIAAALLVAVVLSGCAGGSPSFDPTGPCRVDGRASGAYPTLEALVPKSFDGRPPDHLDSGRNCTPANLGSLASHGVTEVRFAGGLWEEGKQSGVTLAVFEAGTPAGLTLQRDWLFEFYETGARTARSTDKIETSDLTVAGAAGRRLDTLNDESYQTIVVWQSAAPSILDVILIGSDVREVVTRAAHEARVKAALAAFAAAPDGLSPSP